MAVSWHDRASAIQPAGETMTDSRSSSDTPYEESSDVEISPDDLILATKLAQKKGMDVEIYLKALIHDELTRQAKSQPSNESRAESPL
jgi:hypothetical protein